MCQLADAVEAAEAKLAALAAALRQAHEDIQWMSGGWDGSLPDEKIALPHFHAKLAAIDAALADYTPPQDLLEAVAHLDRLISNTQGISCEDCNKARATLRKYKLIGEAK